MTDSRAPVTPAPRRGLALILIAIAALVGAAALTWFLVPRLKARQAGAPAVGADAQAMVEAALREGNEGLQAGATITLENLVANPAGSDGLRYVIATVALEPASVADEERLRGADARVRDLAIGLMGSYPAEWLAGMAQRDSLKQFLADTLAKSLQLSAPPAVLFPQYVLQ